VLTASLIRQPLVCACMQASDSQTRSDKGFMPTGGEVNLSDDGRMLHGWDDRGAPGGDR